MPERPRAGDALPEIACPKCHDHAIVVVEPGSEAHLVGCTACGFSFAVELGEV